VLPERFGTDLDALMTAIGDINKLIDDARQFAQTGGLQ
jgi:hypothetical protein